MKAGNGLCIAAVTVLLYCAIAPLTALAQSVPPPGSSPGLFTSASRAGAQDVKADNTISQTRHVNVDLAQLGDFDAPAATVLLNLFDDVSYSAVFQRVESNVMGSYAWIGRLDGVEYGHAILVVTNELLAGSISLPGANYEVRYSGNGVHAIHKIDQAAFAPELDPIEVPPSDLVPVQDTGADADTCTAIRVLVGYSPEARAAAGGTAAMESLIALAVTETNQSYVNSGLTQRISLAHAMETAPGDATNQFITDLGALANLGDGKFDEIDAARNDFLADTVALIIENSSSCGIGYLNSSATSAFTVTHRTCATGYYSFGHELGHNLSAHHDWYVAGCTSGGSCPYNKGFINLAGRWRTVMAYNNLCSDTVPGTGCNRLPYWSNPNVNYQGSTPMGVAFDGPANCVEGQKTPDPSSCAADNRLAQNNNCSAAANFRVGVPAVCYALSLSHSGSGSDPEASPANSSACGSGNYQAGEVINLTATPDGGWSVSGWSGTSNNASTSTTNQVTMPASAAAVAVTYVVSPKTIGGTTTGLSGSGLVLQNNAGDDLAISANGSFTFATPLADGSGYLVTVKTQPTNLSQTCSVSNGSGTLAGDNVTNVSVTCSTNTYTVGGSVSGLSGTGLVLQNNDGDDLPVSGDSFTFATALIDGSTYAVTVLAQPTGPSQTCSVGNGTGILSGANSENTTVSCTVLPEVIWKNGFEN